MRFSIVGISWILLLSLFLFGCNRQEDNVVARVYDKTLTVEDLQKMIPVFNENSDSVVVRQQYIDSWIARQALLHEAENYLSRKDKQFDKEVENYRQSLIIYAYENKKVEQLLDSKVTDEQVAQYYEENKANFKLRQPIIKINYLKFPIGAQQISGAKALLFKPDRTEQDLEKMKKLTLGSATNIYLSDDWLLYDDILKEVPLKKEKHFPEKNQTFELSDSTFVYLVKILDFQINEGYSPVNIERDYIIKSILQQRRIDILMSLRQSVINKAQESGELFFH